MKYIVKAHFLYLLGVFHLMMNSLHIVKEQIFPYNELVIAPITSLGYVHIHIMNADVVSIGANVAHPFLIDDPSISHGVVVHRCNKEFYGFLPLPIF
jgi:hypothetical protein